MENRTFVYSNASYFLNTPPLHHADLAKFQKLLTQFYRETSLQNVSCNHFRSLIYTSIGFEGYRHCQPQWRRLGGLGSTIFSFVWTGRSTKAWLVANQWMFLLRHFVPSTSIVRAIWHWVMWFPGSNDCRLCRETLSIVILKYRQILKFRH